MRIKITSLEISIYFISQRNYLLKNPKEIESLSINKKTFLRSRYLLNKKSKNFDLNKLETSFSHTKQFSAVAMSDQVKVLGLDIEPINRTVSGNLRKILYPKAKKLMLSEIELWCLMESTFKCRNKKRENFLNYDFQNLSDLFIFKSKQGDIISKVSKYRNLAVSTSILT